MARTLLFFTAFVAIFVAVLALLYLLEPSTVRDVAIGAGVSILALFGAVTIAAEGERTRLPRDADHVAPSVNAEPWARMIEGWFWFPPQSEPAFGTVEINPRDLRLKLRDSPRPQGNSDAMTVIHGESLDGKELTVLGAFVTSRKDFISFDHNVEQFRFNMLLIGAHVLDESELVFERGVVRLRGLREWLSASWQGSAPYAFHELVAPPARGLRERLRAWRLRRSQRNEDETLRHPLEFKVEGATVKLAYRRNTGGTRFERQTVYDAEAYVDLDEPTSLDVWRQYWLRPLLDFLVFATREQIVVESFFATVSDHRQLDDLHPAIRRALPDSAWARRSIEVVRPQVVEVRERGIRPFEHMLLPLGALGLRAPEVLATYFAIYRRLGRTAPFLFVLLNTRTILEENRLLNLMAFSEGFHRTFHDAPPLPDQIHLELQTQMLEAIDKQYRRVYESPLKYANQQSQRQRLKVLIDRAGSAVPALADPRNSFRNALVETRNQYTHQGEPAPNVISDEELHDHVERFIEVLEVNLLIDLGLDASLIRALHAHAHPS